MMGWIQLVLFYLNMKNAIFLLFYITFYTFCKLLIWKKEKEKKKKKKKAQTNKPEV